MNEWKNTEWQDKLKRKPVRYWIRDEIEEIIKEENIDRNRFYEFSKFDYTNIIKRFYYAFANYEQYPKIELSYCWLHFRENLHPGEGRIDYKNCLKISNGQIMRRQLP